MENKKLLVELRYAKSSFEEQPQDKGGKKYIVGEFGIVDTPTENGRIYPRALIEREIERLRPKIESRSLLGELDHPDDGKPRLTRVSHLITELRVDDDNVIRGKAEILDTDNGKNLYALAKAGVSIGVSLRGYGSTIMNENGIEVVQDDFELMTFDFVADPAAHSYGVLKENKSKNGGIEMDNKVKTIEEYNKKLEEAVEAVKKEYGDKLVSEIDKLSISLKHKLEEDLKKKFDNDVRYGLAKQVVENIIQAVKPFMPYVNNTDDELITELEETKNQLNDAMDVIKKANIILRLEQLLEGNPKKELYYELIDFDSVVDENDLVKKVESIKNSIKDDYDKNKVFDIISEVNSKDDEIERLKGVVKELEDKNDKLQKKVEELSDELSSAKRENETIKMKQEQLVDEISAEYEEKIEELNNSIKKFESDIVKYESEINRLKSELDSSLEKYESDISRYESEIKKLETELKKAEDSFEVERDRSDLLEAKLSGLRKIAFRPDYAKYEKDILECKSRSEVEFVVDKLKDLKEDNDFANRRKKLLENLERKSYINEEFGFARKDDYAGYNLDNPGIIKELQEAGLSIDDIKSMISK